MSNETAELLFKQGKLDAAFAQYEQLLIKTPQDENILNNLGAISFMQRNYILAIKYFTQLFEMHSNNINYFFNLINAVINSGSYQKAVYLLNNFLTNNQTTNATKIEIYQRLGYMFLATDQLQEAKAYIDQALELDKKNYLSLEYLGNIYIKQGKSNLAKKAWLASIQVNKKHITCYINLSILLRKEGLLELAEQTCNNALHAVIDAKIYNQLGIIYMEKKQYNTAKTLFLQAIQITPNYREALANLDICDLSIDYNL